MPKVTIVGAGIAGLSAALRLAERGYEVTVFERDSFVGGKFRATKWMSAGGKTDYAYHEHSYHMFLNWYHNFMAMAKDIAVEKSFIPLQSVKFLHAGKFPHTTELVNFGAPSAIFQNLFSGVLPLPDMFLYMYSVLDMLGTPLQRGTSGDFISVNGFAATRPYATETSIGLYNEYLAKTFAVASYLSSAKAFQTFVEYGTYRPVPLYHALDGDSFNKFLKPLQTKLEELGVRFVFGRWAESLTLGADGNVSSITFFVIPDGFDPSLSELPHAKARELPFFRGKDEKEKIGPATEEYAIDGALIMAIPHANLSDVLSPDILNLNPDLGELVKLQSMPMTSVHLHLNEKFDRRMRALGITLPREPVVLVNSNYKLSFVANSRIWSGLPYTYLNIVASDSRSLDSLLAPNQFTSDRKWAPGGPSLSLVTPVTSIDHILCEFRRFLHFEEDEIDQELLQIDRNVGRELFINEVGSWELRPEARTKVGNLFLAGDFCKHFIDVVSLEGATVSGLEAAECVRQKYAVGPPIEIIRPRKYPYPLFWPMTFALAPWAMAAKMWSMCNSMMKRMDGS